MPLPQSARYFTVQEYLAIDRSSEERYEYLDGQIYLMAGESQAHGIISTNLTGVLYNQLRGTSCQAFVKDTKVRSGIFARPRQVTKGLYSYPDLVVVCGGPEYDEENDDIITNPRVIIEVLSPATADFDRGEKFARYRWNDSLTDYILVLQDLAQVEHYHKNAPDDWQLRIYNGLDTSFEIASIGCRLTLRDIYERVEM